MRRDVRDGIPRASRPFESPMTLAVRNSRAPVAPDPSLVAARADEAEADTAQRVATHPSVIDAERDAPYGDGVPHGWPKVLLHAQAWGYPVKDDREQKRLGRLSRWQEQR